MCRVTLGKSFLQFNAMKMAHSPPGHHSVVGRPSVGGLAFPEYVVYRGEQVEQERHWLPGLRWIDVDRMDKLIYIMDKLIDIMDKLIDIMDKLIDIMDKLIEWSN